MRAGGPFHPLSDSQRGSFGSHLFPFVQSDYDKNQHEDRSDDRRADPRDPVSWMQKQLCPPLGSFGRVVGERRVDEDLRVGYD